MQAEAEAYRRSGIAKEEADPPPNLERRDTEGLALAEDIPTPRVSNIPMDEDDEDAATLGRFKPSSDKRGPATARRDDGGDGNFGSDYSASNYSASPTGSQREALLRDEEDNFGSPPQASRAPKSAKSAGPAASSKGEGGASPHPRSTTRRRTVYTHWVDMPDERSLSTRYKFFGSPLLVFAASS